MLGERKNQRQQERESLISKKGDWKYNGYIKYLLLPIFVYTLENVAVTIHGYKNNVT